jgi:3-methyladenine DNA glycosylase/8-oxoguanine DNA glycosylase
MPVTCLSRCENWRPYRTWVTLLLRTPLEGQTGEITGTPRAPGTGSSKPFHP